MADVMPNRNLAAVRVAGESRGAPVRPDGLLRGEASRPATSQVATSPPHAPARVHNLGDRVYFAITGGFAALILVILAGMLAVLLWQSRTSISRFGWTFLRNSTWDPIHNVYGAEPALLGTIYSSLLALLLAAPAGIFVAIFLVEIAPRRLRFGLGFAVELLAAVPSIVYGLWALFILVPIIRQYVQPPLLARFGNTPLFAGYPIGLGMLTAGVILAIMILPTIAAISRDVIQAVPNSQREAMLALGATRWETIWKIVIPHAKSGIIGSVVLGLGRAVGETMAVQMVIGNTYTFGISLFSLGTTMPATIVNQFTEATGPLYRSALLEIGLTLLVVTVVLNAAARLLVWKVGQR